MEQKRFDLQSLSPALHNLWLLLVIVYGLHETRETRKQIYNLVPRVFLLHVPALEGPTSLWGGEMKDPQSYGSTNSKMEFHRIAEKT